MKKKILIIALLFLAVMAAIALKVLFFPSLKDAYFAMDGRSLQKVPPGLIIVRPTRFAFLKEKGILRTQAPSGGNDHLWQMGRNAPLRDIMAAAYNWNPARVALPPDAATGRFDFLMTGTSNQIADLQMLIRRKLGYIAKVESQNADVLALKVADLALPAFTVSGADDKRMINFRNEKLYFTHLPPGVLVNVFGRFLETPMLDKTGLTNSYNFTLNWNSKMDQSYQAGTLTRSNLDQAFVTLGLKLEPDTAPVEMLVVMKAD